MQNRTNKSARLLKINYQRPQSASIKIAVASAVEVVTCTPYLCQCSVTPVAFVVIALAIIIIIFLFCVQRIQPAFNSVDCVFGRAEWPDETQKTGKCGQMCCKNEEATTCEKKASEKDTLMAKE